MSSLFESARPLFVGGIALALLTAATTGAYAQDRYPSRTIKLVVAFSPGGVADIMGRLVAALLQKQLGGTVIVENKPGGDGLIGMGEVVRAQPDGYTLLVGGFGGQIVPPLMKDDFPFDVRRDIVKVAMTAEFANVVVANKDLPVNNIQELIAYIKAAGAVEFRLVGPRHVRSAGGRIVHAGDRHENAQRAVSRRRRGA
jgi:tripartite-type tricarboxylate transporter receptor subunit TctC